MWGTFWPLLLRLLGVAMLSRSGFRRRRDAGAPGDTPGAAPAAGAASGSTGAESIDSSNVFGNVDVQVTSPQFRGGTATTVFGDIVVDCHQGGLADGEHTLNRERRLRQISRHRPPGAALDITAHTLAGERLRPRPETERDLGLPALHDPRLLRTAPKRLHVSVSQVFGDVDVRQ